MITLPTQYDSLDQYHRRLVRQEYARRQDHKCQHCGAMLNEQPAHDIASMPVMKSLFPKEFFDYPIHLHHDRNTGLTIGAVHAHCNAVLWQYHNE